MTTPPLTRTPTLLAGASIAVQGNGIVPCVYVVASDHTVWYCARGADEHTWTWQQLPEMPQS